MKFIITDLGFGDAGKGSVVDFLTHYTGAELIVRYNGGCQAAHNVQHKGRHHTFSQFGSYLGSVPLGGRYSNQVKTLLSKHVLIEPLAMEKEANKLIKNGGSIEGLWNRQYVDERARVITPFHIILNRAREEARTNRHGSCGMGIGETVRDYLENPKLVLQAGDFLMGRALVRDKLEMIRTRLLRELREVTGCKTSHLPVVESFIDRYFPVPFHIATALGSNQMIRELKVIFEGAQGVLLDEDYGFHPYTTWSKTTPHNARELLRESGSTEKPTLIGLTRSYMCRHGDGPFPTEAQTGIVEIHNGYNPWQRHFRTGWLDLVLLKYAVAVSGGIDFLGVTHTDTLNLKSKWPICTGYGPDVVKDFLDYCNSDTAAAPGSLAHLDLQQSVGEQIMYCQKGLWTASRDDMLDIVSEELDTPIKLTSFGPDRSQKDFRL